MEGHAAVPLLVADAGGGERRLPGRLARLASRAGLSGGVAESSRRAVICDGGVDDDEDSIRGGGEDAAMVSAARFTNGGGGREGGSSCSATLELSPRTPSNFAPLVPTVFRTADAATIKPAGIPIALGAKRATGFGGLWVRNAELVRFLNMFR